MKAISNSRDFARTLNRFGPFKKPEVDIDQGRVLLIWKSDDASIEIEFRLDSWTWEVDTPELVGGQLSLWDRYVPEKVLNTLRMYFPEPATILVI